MTESAWPFDPQDTSETQYSQLFRRAISSGAVSSPSATELKPFGDSTGMQIKIPAGFAVVRGHMYWNDATLTKAVGASVATPRIDTVVLELDPSTDSIVAKVVAGTAGSGVPPVLTQTDTAVYQLPLADVLVDANATTIAAGKVTDRRPFTGSDFGVWTTDTRPASPRPGKAGLNTTLGYPEFYDGSTWKGFAPTTVDPTLLSAAVPITKGGTGQTTKLAALNALGIWPQATEPGGAVNGDLWFW